MFQGGLEGVIEALSLSTMRSLPLPELPIEEALWEAVICHAVNMADPSKLGAHECCMDALHLGSLECLRVWNFVLPFDAEQRSQTSHVEGVHLSGMATVSGPHFAGVQ